MGTATLGTAMVVVWLFLFLLAVLWFLLPFAVFGTKPLIREAIKEAKEANALLKTLTEQQREIIEQQRDTTARLQSRP